MLSSQFTGPQCHHKRQNSTPVASGVPMGAPYAPVLYHQHQTGHRRGLSLDQSMYAGNSAPTTPSNGTVSIDQGTNQQQDMRATQMRGPARPGHHHNASEGTQKLSNEIKDFSNTPQPQNDVGYFGTFGLEAGYPADPQCMVEDSAMLSLGGSMHTSNVQNIPQTPRKQFAQGAYPMTPNTGGQTQQSRILRPSPILEESFDFAATPAATPMKRGRSCQESSSMRRPESSGRGMPSPPSTAPLYQSATFDVAPLPSPGFLDISVLNVDFSACSTGYNSSNYSPMTNRTSPAASSLQSSPELAPVSLFGELSGDIPLFPASGSQASTATPKKGRSPSPKKKSSQMPDEMIIEDTGVTTEQVDAFIQGPEAGSNKYTCLYEGCKMKPFGRKENIRAHVQTHLGDRKYVCAVCNNRFVRPNDLKRHAIIHQETREYVCKCGAAFGRQDALRRHRIRKNFCVDGDPTLEAMRKEEKKRGRPKKIAPTETAERRERKENIRKQIMSKTRDGSVCNSAAASHTSPEADFSSAESEPLEPLLYNYSPGADMSFTPPASPEDTTPYSVFKITPENQNQQSTESQDSSPPPTRGSTTASHEAKLSLGSDSDFDFGSFGSFNAQALAVGMTKGMFSRATTPPELDPSSSSPASRFVELDPTANSKASSQSSDPLFSELMMGNAPPNLDDMFPLFGENFSQLSKGCNGFSNFESGASDEAIWREMDQSGSS